jgi:DNA-binding CsgD family transcriptional regulator
METISGKREQSVVVTAATSGPESGLAAMADELAHAILLTTVDARLVHANQAARHELERGDAVAMSGGCFVRASQPESNAELQVALARSAHGRRALIQLDAKEGAPLVVAVVPLKRVAGDRACCAILFSRQRVCDALMLGFFARRHNLTRAEEHVLVVLSEGVLAPQAAARLNVAVSTIRSHVRSICAKTRTRSVRELLLQLAVLPPMAPALAQHPVH